MKVLPEMTSQAPAVVPPTVLDVAPETMSRPLMALGTAAVPAALVPIKSPSTTLLEVPESEI